MDYEMELRVRSERTSRCKNLFGLQRTEMPRQAVTESPKK